MCQKEKKIIIQRREKIKNVIIYCIQTMIHPKHNSLKLKNEEANFLNKSLKQRKTRQTLPEVCEKIRNTKFFRELSWH